MTEEIRKNKENSNKLKIWKRTVLNSLFENKNGQYVASKRTFLRCTTESGRNNETEKTQLSANKAHFQNSILKTNSKEPKGFFVSKKFKIEQNSDFKSKIRMRNIFGQKENKTLQTALAIMHQRNDEKILENQIKPEKKFTSLENAHQVYLMNLKVNMINNEVKTLQKNQLCNEQLISESEKQKLSEFSKQRALYQMRKKLMDDATEQINNKIDMNILISKELKANQLVLNNLKSENKKAEEKLAYYEMLYEFQQNIAPQGLRDKNVREK